MHIYSHEANMKIKNLVLRTFVDMNWLLFYRLCCAYNLIRSQQQQKMKQKIISCRRWRLCTLFASLLVIWMSIVFNHNNNPIKIFQVSSVYRNIPHTNLHILREKTANLVCKESWKDASCFQTTKALIKFYQVHAHGVL